MIPVHAITVERWDASTLSLSFSALGRRHTTAAMFSSECKFVFAQRYNVQLTLLLVKQSIALFK